MKVLFAVAMGGLVGAVARYATSLAVSTVWRRPFPLGTFLINVVGSLLLGVAFALFERRTEIDPAWRVFLITGVLGAFTTFSTFELETQQLRHSGFNATAAFYVIASVACGYLALHGGLILGRR